MRAGCIALLLGGLAGAAHADPAALPTGDWNFSATLDGTEIGTHRFSVSGQGDERDVVSEADFAVKLLGFTAYHYHHRATEHWRGACLRRLDASTDDDGKTSQVQERPTQDCVMSFAYWNPAMCGQTRLLNAQTGKFESVKIERVGSGTVEVHGKPVPATEFRITGAAQPISVWYAAADGRWVGLDSTVAGDRKLSYRLQ